MSLQPVEATHNSRCGLCDGAINEGEVIVKVDDEWVHADCAEDAGETVKARAWD
jgi:hypothetical protein